VICTPVRARFVSIKSTTVNVILLTSNIAYFSDGLAAAGNAPKIFMKTNRRGLPYPSIIFCAMFALLAYMGINSGSGKVFQWFSNMTSVAG
jgi:amino acid transporter